MQETWQCRWSPTLGALEDTHQKVWGTAEYADLERPTVFFGLYGLPDFYALWRHKGRRCILWTGSDIRHFADGYWLDEAGSIRLDPKALADWIAANCESYVENEVEFRALARMRIVSKIVPSFLGDASQFPISYAPGRKLYTSVSGNDFELYGWDMIPTLAVANPDIEFHLYGNTEDPPWAESRPANVIIHGRVPKERMNQEISQMQGALRLTSFDGFSEILAKSVLMGQWPVSLIGYPHMLGLADMRKIMDRPLPNLEGRQFYMNEINRYPWNQNKK